MALTSTKPDTASARRGFTLVELMVSIAIALLLMIGINQVFSIAQKTAGAGNQLSDAVRTGRMFQGRLYQDFRAAVVNDAPFFMFIGQPHPAWRNKADQTTDRDGNVLTANDPFGTGSRPAYSLASVNERVHRIDRLMFFARDLFQRQTADAPNLVSPTTSYEGFIWYGHLALPNNNTIFSNATSGAVWTPIRPDLGNWFNPGEPDRNTTNARNDNNLFASDWILGRQQMLLMRPPLPPQSSTNSAPETSIIGATNTTPLAMMKPFNGRAKNAQATYILASRYDMALTTMDECRQFIINTPANQWWRLFAYTVNQFNRPGDTADARFYANPFPRRAPQSGNTPVSPNVAETYLSAGVAQSAPILIRGCSDFIVEYAGNFLQQNQDPTSPQFGQITGIGPDPSGKLDFIPEPANGISGPPWTRRTRWYGFPRRTDHQLRPGDSAGHEAVSLTAPPGQSLNSATSRKTSDVLPLRDVIAGAGGSGIPTFERFISFNLQRDYGTPNAFGTSNVSSSPDPVYVCAWAPDTTLTPKPKMLRITMSIDDPAARLPNAQSYEYVVELP